MRKLTFALLLGLLLSFGLTFAQEDSDDVVVVVQEDEAVLDATDTSPYYAGASLGFAAYYGATATFSGHFGFQDLLAQDLDLRADLTVPFSGGGVILGGNALYNFDVNTDAPLGVYAGGGLRLAVGGGAAFGLGLLGGANYAFSSVFGGFAELRIDTFFGSGTLIGLGAGVNYYF